MTDETPLRRRVHVVVALVITALVSLGAGRPVSAHTDFDSSSPADGAVVTGPVAEVVVNFTNPARPAGDEFQLLEPSGTVRLPSSVDETDGTSFVLTFDPPLEAGTYALRWSVQAGDAHPIDGSIRFEVTATGAGSAGTTGGTTADDATATATGGHDMDADMAMTMDDDAHTGMDAAEHATMSNEAIDRFLDGDSTIDDSIAVGRVGRAVSMLGIVFGVGVLAALLWTIRGRRDELTSQLGWVRLAGVAIFAGGLIELAALAESDPTSSLGTLMSTKAGLATVLKMVGGLAVLIGFHDRAGRFVAPTTSLSAAVATDLGRRAGATSDATRHELDRSDGHRWTPTPTAALGLLGCALVLGSFWFDGHTVTRGPWAIHALVNLAHVGAAAVWGGGVFAMTTVAWMRHRRSERLGLAAMVVRFSSAATASLIAVTVAGLLMTWMILDTPGDLVGTSWGRVLVAKTSLVAVAACLGGYNHIRLRPALEARPDDPRLARELRISLTIESAVFVAIVLATAVLVASAT